MESFLFWILNSVETGLILGLLLHIWKADRRISNAETRLVTRLKDLENQIPNCFTLNGETIRLRKKD